MITLSKEIAPALIFFVFLYRWGFADCGLEGLEGG